MNQQHAGWQYSGGGAQQRVGGQPVGQRGGWGHGLEAAGHGSRVHGNLQVPTIVCYIIALLRKFMSKIRN